MIPIGLRRSLPREGELTYKGLPDYTNEELIYYINNNMTVDLSMMAGILSEILRRMNEKKPLLPPDDTDWANPLTP